MARTGTVPLAHLSSVQLSSGIGPRTASGPFEHSASWNTEMIIIFNRLNHEFFIHCTVYLTQLNNISLKLFVAEERLDVKYSHTELNVYFEKARLFPTHFGLPSSEQSGKIFCSESTGRSERNGSELSGAELS
jgi:hypothetical protein